MKLPFKERWISTAIVIPSAIIVIALAVLEYRWSARISDATAVRLADSLQMSMMNWQKDFFRSLSEISLALRIDPVEDASGDVGQYARRIAEWKAVAKYPSLVSNVYILQPDDTVPTRALKLNSSAQRFEARDWPVEFEPLRKDLKKASAVFLARRADAAHAPGLQANSFPNPRIRDTYGLFFDVGDPSAGWRFEPSIPALLHPIVASRGTSPEWIAIELNQSEIRGKILSDLSQTYFQGTEGLDYQVAVISLNRPRHVIYSSDAGFGDPEPSDADGTIDVFGRPQDGLLASPVHVFHTPSDTTAASAKISWFPLLRERAENLDWRLIVKHRRGGALGAFVEGMRRRDLAIGFGVLLVLVVNMAMLIVTSHRAQRLAQLQMNFVTAVSHELRTPLTVIISGSDNLCSGVVETPQQMARYGAVIGNQARQLYGLVERILLFAATRQGRQRYHLRRLQVHEIVDSALASTTGLIEAGNFTVERDIQPELPDVMGDASALSQCLQNLITNALKYGEEQRWLGIRASIHASSQEVEISVTDRGIGISDADLPHIFEPFYRSPSVRAAQIHGTGLGLPLSQSIAEAMKGRLGVTSSAGAGSTFTLYLPWVERFVPDDENGAVVH